LVREMSHDPSIDTTIERLQREPSIKVAFARYSQGHKFAKFLNDAAIIELT